MKFVLGLLILFSFLFNANASEWKDIKTFKKWGVQYRTDVMTDEKLCRAYSRPKLIENKSRFAKSNFLFFQPIINDSEDHALIFYTTGVVGNNSITIRIDKQKPWQIYNSEPHIVPINRVTGDDNFQFEKLKKGNQIAIRLNMHNQGSMTTIFSLAGFTKAFNHCVHYLYSNNNIDDCYSCQDFIN